MTDYPSGGDAKSVDFAYTRLVGGISLGTLHDQRFYAIRANGSDLRFPFASQPFTVLVDITRPVDDSLLQGYAEALIGHGCVQAVCRGGESGRMVEIFDELADKGDLDHDGAPFTSMFMDDEPLDEAIQYFVLPSGLAHTGLLMVIGDSSDFQGAIHGFSTAAGAVKEGVGEPVFTETDLVCFVSS